MKLDGVRRNGAGWMARCPTHEDLRASLSIAEAEDGKVLVTCFAGCELDAITSALGITIRDLFSHQERDREARVVATYRYTDEADELLFAVDRLEPKRFRQWRPNGSGKVYRLDGVRRVPYRLPALRAAIAAGREIYVVEGERDVETLERANLVGTCNAGGAGKWRDEWVPLFTGARVAILTDNDEPGRKHARQVASSLQGVATVKVVSLPDLPVHGDVSDWLAAGHTAEHLRALVAEADESSASRQWMNGRDLSDADGAALLDRLHDSFTTFVVFPSPEHADMVTLWTAATHGQPAWQHATRLPVDSPAKRCGKTRLLDVIEATCHKPLVTVNATVAAVFRSIDEADPPTLIVDEADTIFGKRANDNAEELRGLLNAGFGRGRPALRCVGPNQIPTGFATFAMAALAAIGDAIPDTIKDRGAGTVRMRRRGPGENVKPYRVPRDAYPLHELRDELHAWVRSSLRILADATPDLPVEDRAADAWEPLVAIADAAGGTWPERARAACRKLVADADAAAVEESLDIKLLEDIREVFKEPVIASATLIERLRDRDESPWRTFDFTQNDLARRLRPYGVRPDRVRPDGADGPQVRGYGLADLTNVFARYLPRPDRPSQSVTPSHEQVNPVTLYTSVTGASVTADETVTGLSSRCDAVTVWDAVSGDVGAQWSDDISVDGERR